LEKKKKFFKALWRAVGEIANKIFLHKFRRIAESFIAMCVTRAAIYT